MAYSVVKTVPIALLDEIITIVPGPRFELSVMFILKYRHENIYGIYVLFVAFFCGTAYKDQLVSVYDLFSGISVIIDT